MRRIYENENLSGQTLTGPGIQARFYNCDLTDTVFVGDWAGADYIDCDCTRTDWARANTYASYWYGCLPMEGAGFPLNIGYLHHEPMTSLIRNRLDYAVSQTPANEREEARRGLEAVRDEISQNYGCGWQSPVEAIRRVGADPFLTARAAGFVFEDHRQALHRLIQWSKEVAEGAIVVGLREDVTLDFDGHPLVVTAAELRELSLRFRFDRYELARHFEAQGNVLTGGTYNVFVETIIPPGATVFPTADFWYVNRKGGL